MKEYIAAGILFLISALAFFMSVRSFMEKGFLFNNAYIWATKQEREKLNKKPHYRQSAVVFLLLGLVFLLNGFNLLFKTNWVFYIVLAVIVIAIVYAVASSIKIGKDNRNIN